MFLIANMQAAFFIRDIRKIIGYRMILVDLFSTRTK